ncbi:PLDc N-terminal domain-containing protein [Natronococcus wangiae]|uniref:PLDc N-terminal domain-containing protein n=1 Tax=Natronococcus wangiae TaxID=3068275 RepID=UPI00387EE69C
MIPEAMLQSGWRGEFGSFLLVLILMVNLSMAVWAFTDAFSWENDNQSPTMWAVVVFLLSIAGFFLYLMLGRETTSSHSRRSRSRGGIIR